MAQKVNILLIDDIDGSPASGTTRFALDGSNYEIELSDKHDTALRNTLREYIDKARKAGGKPVKSKPVHTNPVDNQAIRQWAKNNGYPDINERGRIPTAIVTEYHAVNG